MSERFSKSPSDYWGFTDRRLIADFDRLHNLRAGIAETVATKSIKPDDDPKLPDRRIFESAEGIKFS